MTAPSPYAESSPPAAPRRASTEGECRTTIRINGGPEIPFDDAGKEKLKEHFAQTLGVAHDDASKPRPGGIAADQLRSIVERIERLEEEKADLVSDIKDIFAEARGNGYDVKTLRKIIALRRQDAAERDEAQHLLDTYCRALGMTPDLFDDKT